MKWLNYVFYGNRLFGLDFAVGSGGVGVGGRVCLSWGGGGEIRVPGESKLKQERNKNRQNKICSLVHVSKIVV